MPSRRDNRLAVQVRWIEPDATIGARRGDVVVCIPVYGGHEYFVSCLRSVLAHTPPEVPILICDDASPDLRSVAFVRSLGEAGETAHVVHYLRRELNLGFPGNVNGAFAIAAPADVVVLNSDCEVADGWLQGLCEAAYADSRVATATSLTNHGTLVSLPERGRPMPQLPQDWSFEDAAAAVRAHSLRIRPRLPTAIGHCLYVRRSALELVGDFDLAFSPGYGEEVDFSQRCLRSGLSHVLADEVLVLHHGGVSFAANGRADPVKEAHEKIIAARYPYYHDAVHASEREVTGPLARALSVARRALKGLSVVIDARVLSGAMTGTQVHVLELIAALARTERVRVTVIVPEVPGADAVRLVRSLPGLELLTRAEIAQRDRRADLVHRPYQLQDEEDLAFLGRLAERLVVTNQDLIGYHNPSYFRSFRAWEGYRAVTRATLGLADRVLFFSAHARDDALAEDLVEPERASVVHIGVDHAFIRTAAVSAPPRGAIRLPEGTETILCIGTDFRHKNRLFALRLLEQLQRRHGWEGRLLLVGPRVAHGSSAPDEAEALALRPAMAEAVLDFAAVSEAEKAWLLERAGLVLYPTVHEGFGLVPFEAADHDVPCMWARGTSLSEVLPDAAAEIVPWDVEQSAERALVLLRDAEARTGNLEAIRAAAAQHTWDATAARLLEIYEQTCDKPATPAGGLDRPQGLNVSVSEDAMRLIGPGGALPEELERPLLALATHKQVADPVFRALKVGYRASFRLRRLRGGGHSGESER